MSWRPATVLLRLALIIPCIYHGVWNLSADGGAWWSTQSGLPVALRFVVGAAELAAALSLATGVLTRWAALGLTVLFLGAIPQHFAAGFSFKKGGYEVPLIYALLALSIALSPPKGAQHAND